MPVHYCKSALHLSFRVHNRMYLPMFTTPMMCTRRSWS